MSKSTMVSNVNAIGHESMVTFELNTIGNEPSFTTDDWKALDTLLADSRKVSDLIDTEKYSLAFVLSGSHPFALHLMRFMDANDQSKADLVKMALVRYTKYDGEIPSSKGSVTGYDTKSQALIRNAIVKAVRAMDMALAEKLGKFDKVACDAVIAAANANAKQRKNGKVTVK